MTVVPTTGVVVDTMVMSWLLREQPDECAERYRALIGDRAVLLAFQTVTELRRARLERRLAELTVVQPDDQMITICAQLRHDCRQLGHALADKIHDGDRWIAATAVRLGLPLATDDGIFDGVPRLELLTAH